MEDSKIDFNIYRDDQEVVVRANTSEEANHSVEVLFSLSPDTYPHRQRKSTIIDNNPMNDHTEESKGSELEYNGSFTLHNSLGVRS